MSLYAWDVDLFLLSEAASPVSQRMRAFFTGAVHVEN
jgi:hypothetical protein